MQAFIVISCFAFVSAFAQAYQYEPSTQYFQHDSFTRNTFPASIDQPFIRQFYKTEPFVYSTPQFTQLPQFAQAAAPEVSVQAIATPIFPINAAHSLNSVQPALPVSAVPSLQIIQPPKSDFPPAPPIPIVTKHFFVHSAPEEPEEDAPPKEVNLGPARKHFRVVFIKAPSQFSKSAKLSIVQPHNEEKTVIYVLTKKTDADDIRTAIEDTPTTPSKPEVFFIKYKTPEEAAHAQKQIQAQYDVLGGTSEVSDEGVAPVSSVIGVLGNSHQSKPDAAHSREANEYLPPKY